jgi:hypothetical protein
MEPRRGCHAIPVQALICLNDGLATKDRQGEVGFVIGPSPCRVSMSRKGHIALNICRGSQGFYDKPDTKA